MNRNVADRGRERHIGVFGHYGHHNMGDEAIIEAVIRNLQHRRPSWKIVGLSMNPEDTARRYGIPAYAIRQRKPTTGNSVDRGGSTKSDAAHDVSGVQAPSLRDRLKRIALLRSLVHVTRFMLFLPVTLWREAVFLGNAYRTVRKLDFLVIAGSNQFLDNFGGVWGFPWTLLKWTVLARLANVRVVYLSVGAGPIKSRWSRVMGRAALLLADYASFRDVGSRQLMEWAGSGGDWRVYPDLAQSLPVKRQSLRSDGQLPVVGINPMPVYDRRSWCEPDDARYERYVTELAKFASRLVEDGYPIFFFTTQPSDAPVIDDIVARFDPGLSHRHGVPDRRTSETVQDAMRIFASADVIIPTRYHGTVLGLHAGRPVLGICYYRKTREVLESMGQGDYALDIDSISHDDPWQRFQRLVSRRFAEAETIARAGEELGIRLAEQYDSVLNILERRGVRGGVM